MFMILVLIMMAYIRDTQVFNGKEWHSIKCIDLLKSTDISFGISFKFFKVHIIKKIKNSK